MPYLPVETARFRPLRTDDADFLWEMLRLAVFTRPGEPPPSAEAVKSPPLAGYVEAWMRPDDIGVLASLAGEPVGAAWARFFPERAPGYGQVAPGIPELSVAVLPQYRGMGLGSRLMGRLIDLAKPRAGSLSLSVAPDNPARRLYQRLDFRIVKQRGDALVMLLVMDSAREP